MGTQHAQRVVVKRNTCTEDNTQRVSTSISGLYKHAQQQFNNGIECNVRVTMFVSVCTIITGQDYCYCMPHHAIMIMYRSM